MPLAAATHRVQILANLRDGETMAHTFWVRINSNLDAIDAAQTAAKVRDSWDKAARVVTGTNSLLNLLTSETRYTKVLFYKMDEVTGRALDVGESAFAATMVGTSVSPLPTEVAAAVTLLTGGAGRHRRGRVFLGGFGRSAMEDSTARVAAGPSQTLSTHVANFCKDIAAGSGTAADVGLREVVVHSLTRGTASRITQCQTGNVFDVQRRRRNKIVEVRTSAIV